MKFSFWLILEMALKFWEYGLQFECRRCDNCCTFEGGAVFASKKEFKKIAQRLKLSFKSFLEQYTKDIENHISLKLKDNGHCIFYESGCSIYEDRPVQCKTYPFWPELLKSEFRWLNEAYSCRGINKGERWSAENIKSELEKSNISLMSVDERE